MLFSGAFRGRESRARRAAACCRADQQIPGVWQGGSRMAGGTALAGGEDGHDAVDKGIANRQPASFPSSSTRSGSRANGCKAGRHERRGRGLWARDPSSERPAPQSQVTRRARRVSVARAPRDVSGAQSRRRNIESCGHQCWGSGVRGRAGAGERIFARSAQGDRFMINFVLFGSYSASGRLIRGLVPRVWCGALRGDHRIHQPGRA